MLEKVSIFHLNLRLTGHTAETIILLFVGVTVINHITVSKTVKGSRHQQENTKHRNLGNEQRRLNPFVKACDATDRQIVTRKSPEMQV